MIFPSQKKNNRTVRVLKTPKTDSSVRKVFIPKSVAQCLIDLKADQDEIKEVLGNEYQDYNLERYQQTVIHRIANVDSKVIIST